MQPRLRTVFSSSVSQVLIDIQIMGSDAVLICKLQFSRCVMVSENLTPNELHCNTDGAACGSLFE
jgi:hypothetical protein